MPMSQSASSSPTPRSTSRVMMTGLIGPDLRRGDCWSGPSHDDWRKTCLMESCRKTWHIPRTVEQGRYHIYRVPPTFCGPRRVLSQGVAAVRRGEGLDVTLK